MKYPLLILSALVILSISAYSQTDTAAAPEVPSIRISEVSVWGGLSYPYLPLEFRENWKSGYNLGVSYGYCLEPGTLGYGAISISADYARMKRDYEKYDSVMRITPTRNVTWGGAVRSLSFMVNFRATFAKDTKSIGPYLQVGIGYTSVVQEEIVSFPDTSYGVAQSSKSALGWSAAAGIDVPFGENAVFFAQFRSVIAVLDPTRQYFPLNAGVRYRW